MIDDGVKTRACPVEQTDDGGVDAPRFIRPRRAQSDRGLRRMDTEPRAAPATRVVIAACRCDRIVSARDCRPLRRSRQPQESDIPIVIGEPAVHDDEKEGEGRFSRRRGAPVRRPFLSRIGTWLLRAVIMGIVPLAASLWVRSLVADYVPMLKQATSAAAAGNAAVVAVSFSVVLFLEYYAYWKMGPSAGRADGAPITGRLQFLILYVLVPLVPGLAVGYLTLSPATPLSRAVDWIRQPPWVQLERQVGQAIQDAAAGETRVAGIRALAQFGSPDALNELVRLATADSRLLNDSSSFDAFASALASVGRQSEPLLQTMWKESRSKPAEGKTPADLVLAAYNRLDAIADTTAAYGIAREAAVAPSSSPERRAAAIAVVARSGSRSDFAWLASFLVEQPEQVKQAALDALRQLDARLGNQEAPLVTNADRPVGR
jgi:hypothetical protein